MIRRIRRMQRKTLKHIQEERRGKTHSYSKHFSGIAVEHPDDINSIVEKARK